MSQLGDFIRASLTNHQAGSEARSKTKLILQETLSAQEADGLAGMIEEYATSQDFVDAVNRSVPPPKDGETEDEFVKRANEAIQRILMNRFVR